MVANLPRVIALAVLATLLVPHPTTAETELPRERVGVRAGFIGTSGNLNNAYGNGTNISIHFSERMVTPLYFHVRIGAVYLHDLKQKELAEAVTEIEGINSEMRFSFASIGAETVVPLAGIPTYISLGGGVYSVSIVYDSGLQAFDFSDQHFGLNAGIGTLLPITETWNLDVNLTAHKIWTPTNTGNLYYYYTSQGQDPLLTQLAVGITLELY